MMEMKDEFLSEEDLDLRNLPWDEVVAAWNLWLLQAQASNPLDEPFYSHGVFLRDPAVPLPDRIPEHVAAILHRLEGSAAAADCTRAGDHLACAARADQS